MAITHNIPLRSEHIFMVYTIMNATWITGYFFEVVIAANFYLDYSSSVRSPEMIWKRRFAAVSLRCHLLVLVFLHCDDLP